MVVSNDLFNTFKGLHGIDFIKRSASDKIDMKRKIEGKRRSKTVAGRMDTAKGVEGRFFLTGL